MARPFFKSPMTACSSISCADILLPSATLPTRTMPTLVFGLSPTSKNFSSWPSANSASSPMKRSPPNDVVYVPSSQTRLKNSLKEQLYGILNELEVSPKTKLVSSMTIILPLYVPPRLVPQSSQTQSVSLETNLTSRGYKWTRRGE